MITNLGKTGISRTFAGISRKTPNLPPTVKNAESTYFSMSKRARLNQLGLSTVAFLIRPQRFDGLTGTLWQAIVPSIRTTGESLLGIA